MDFLWVKGYVILKTKSLDNERFFNLCNNHKIKIFNLDVKEGTFRVSVKDYYKLRPICRKSKPGLVLLRKQGLGFEAAKILKNYGFITGIMLFMALMMIIGRFVWNISIEGNLYNSDDQFRHYLESKGIDYGTRKNQIDCEELERCIRKDFDEVVWVSVALKGTRLTVEVRENTDEVVSIPEGEPSDIVACADGVVMYIVTRSGTAKVKAGDVVQKGDVLISGKVTIVDEAYQPVADRYVYADGDVYIKESVSYQDELGREYDRKDYTGRMYKTVECFLGGKSMKIDPYKEKYEYSDIFSECYNMRLYQNFYLPMRMVTVKHREFVLSRQKYADDEMEAILAGRLSYYFEKLEEKGIQILENNVTIQINDNEAHAGGEIYVLEKSDLREAIAFEYN